MSGGNCPETPRQKMIGMMYLFLTAMLALNVSGELLKAFQLVDKSIQQTISTVESRNYQLEAKLNNALLVNEKKARGAKIKADSIKLMADSLYNHIQNLKILMVHTVDGPEATLDNYKGIDNQDVAAQLMITERNGERSEFLKKLINDYRNLLISYINPKDSFIIKPIMETLITEPLDNEAHQGEVVHKSWESQMFEHLPLSASFALMSSIQSDVRTAQADVVNYLLTEIDEGSFKFTKIEPIIKPVSNIVIQGDKYEADIFLAARDEYQDPEILVDGKKLEVVDGRGKYSVPATRPGEYEYEAELIITAPNGRPQKYTIKDKYRVIKPNVVISPVKMNVFYEGVDNPVKISVPGIPSSDLIVSISNCRNKKVGDLYIVRPLANKAGRKSIVTVSAKIKDQTRRIGSGEFRIKRVPDPVAKIAGISSGKIKKGTLLAQEAIFAEMGDDFDFDLEFRVTGFTVSIIKGGYVRDARSTNNRITAEQKELMKSVGRGGRVIIEGIKAVGPDKRPRKLNSIALTID
ncbi:MAG: gliding motility protein GldM [Chlorobi bacterium]|nr:gliding motility protein GldM [Chlorobiota bacterium]